MKVVHFYAYGDIGEADNYFEVFTGSSDPIISTKKVSEFINNLEKDVTDVSIHINSRGGSVNEGFAIHDLLINCGKVVTTIVEGQAASIASVILLAGSKRQITENSTVMIHNPWIDPWSMSGQITADEIQSIADEMKVAETKISDFYISKTGIDKTQLQEFMKSETTFNADKALELNFATEILKPIKAFAYISNPKEKKENQIMSKLTDALNSLMKKMDIKAEDSSAASKTISLTTKEGKKISVADPDGDGSPMVGDVVTDDSGTTLTSQTITLDDDSTITTDDKGVITATTPKAAASNDAVALATEISALKEENKKLSDKLNAQALAHDLENKEVSSKLDLIMKNIKSEHNPKTGATTFRTSGEATPSVNRVRDANPEYFKDKK